MNLTNFVIKLEVASASNAISDQVINGASHILFHYYVALS
jgi:hypothetical protein